MNLALHGSCQVPIAGYATLDGDALHLRALVGDAASGETLRAESHGSVDDPEALGRSVASQLHALGADRLLNSQH
jgi:hydroxymethylbilane synthase